MKAAKAENSEVDKLSAETHPVPTSSTVRVQASGQPDEKLAQSVKNLSVIDSDTSCISESGSVQRPKVSKSRVEYGRVRTRHVSQLFIRGENVLLVNIQRE